MQAAVVGQTDDSLIIGGGARPIGMGRAFTAVAEDADAPLINAAGIATLKGPSAMAMFTNLLGDIYYSEFTGAVPTPWGTVGAAYVTTGTNGISGLGSTPSGLSDYYDSLFLMSYSTAVQRFAEYGANLFVGGNFKFFSRGFSGDYNLYASGISADLGLKYILNPYLSFGLSRQNFLPVSFGGKLSFPGGAEEAISGLTKLGVALKPIQFKRNLLIALDTDIPALTGRPLTSHLGVEWQWNDFISFRAGLDQSVDAADSSRASWNPAFGTSFSYAGLRVDYAFHQYYNEPGLATSFVSLSYTGRPWFALKGRTD